MWSNRNLIKNSPLSLSLRSKDPNNQIIITKSNVRVMLDMQDVYENLTIPPPSNQVLCLLRMIDNFCYREQVNCVHATTMIITCICKIHKAISFLLWKTFIIIQKALTFILTFILTQKKNDAENFIKSPRKPSNLPNFLIHANFMYQ